MSRPIIRVEELGKAYRIGTAQDRLPTFREAVVEAIKSPVRRLRVRALDGSKDEIIWALKDVSFEVQPGEVVGIIGRNGAGKSTLLKVLSRITEPTRGCVRLRGRVASLLEVGTGFHPELTGRENIYLNGSLLGMRRAEIDRRFDEIVEFAEIERFLDTPVKRYSSGMYVRLAFSVAAHLEPEILVVDEVLSVGDSIFQRKCLGKMEEITGLGRTIIFVSHNLAVVRSLCTTCCLIDKGHLIYHGEINSGVDVYLKRTLPEDLIGTARFSRPCREVPWMCSASLVTDGNVPGVVRMGDRIRLVVEFTSPTPLRNPRFGLIISNGEGQRLLNANNVYQPCHELKEPTTEGIVDCDLGMVPLMPGRYTVSFWFGGDNSIIQEHVVHDALTFEVVEHDAWGKRTDTAEIMLHDVVAGEDRAELQDKGLAMLPTEEHLSAVAW